MKQFFLSAALLVGAALSFTACNNGTYDTDPATNNSGTGNPFNTGGSGGSTPSAALGTIVFKQNGELKTISNSVYTLDQNNTLAVSGIDGNPPNFSTMTVQVRSYSGVKAYSDKSGPDDLVIAYPITENLAVAKLWTSVGEINGLKINITEEADNKVKGTFEGVLYNAVSGQPNYNDSLVITEGRFYVGKQGQ